MNRFATAPRATRLRLAALTVAGLALAATATPPARAAAPAPVPTRVMDLGTIEGIVVTPHGNYSQSEWDARQRRFAAVRARRFVEDRATTRAVSLRAPSAPSPALWRSVAATLPGADAGALAISLPTPRASF